METAGVIDRELLHLVIAGPLKVFLSFFRSDRMSFIIDFVFKVRNQTAKVAISLNLLFGFLNELWLRNFGTYYMPASMHACCILTSIQPRQARLDLFGKRSIQSDQRKIPKKIALFEKCNFAVGNGFNFMIDLLFLLVKCNRTQNMR